MTYEKTVHYIGKELAEFIAGLPASKLETMKICLLREINDKLIPAETLWKYTAELEYIKQLLKTK